MTERRFTDDEVARIIGRAVEIDRREEPSSAVALARGLTLGDLQEVAREVGISPETIARAALELDRAGGSGGLDKAFFGRSPVAQRVQLVDRPLKPEELAEIIRVVDEEAPDQGTVTEALGSVRWGSRGRFLSRQITLQPTADETRIQVQERYQERARGMSHMIPTLYGLGLGAGVGLGEIGGLGGVVVALLSTVVGWGLGRGFWHQLRVGSARRVDRISNAISRAVAGLKSEGELPQLPDGIGSNAKNDAT